MDNEESNSMEDSDVGLMIPRPPHIAGRARRSQTRLFGGGLPVREGIRLSRMQSSSG